MNVSFTAASQSWTLTWQETLLCLHILEGNFVSTYLDWQQVHADHFMLRRKAQNALLQAEYHWQVEPLSGGTQHHTVRAAPHWER